MASFAPEMTVCFKDGRKAYFPMGGNWRGRSPNSQATTSTVVGRSNSFEVLLELSRVSCCRRERSAR